VPTAIFAIFFIIGLDFDYTDSLRNQTIVCAERATEVNCVIAAGKSRSALRARLNGSGGKIKGGARKRLRGDFLLVIDLTVPADPREHDASQVGFQKSVRLGKRIIEPGAFFKLVSIHVRPA